LPLESETELTWELATDDHDIQGAGTLSAGERDSHIGLRGLGDRVIALDEIRSDGQGAGSQKKRSQTGEQGIFGRASPGQREKDSRDKVLTEGPHSQIAKDPQRRWTQDL
jgi:hypothetical protein